MHWPDEAPDFQEKTWRLERAFAVAIVVVLALSVTGVFGGGGKLARAVSRAEGIEASHPRFWRRTVPERIALRLSPPGDSIWIDADLVEKGGVQAVEPTPIEFRAEGGKVRYRFATAVAEAALELKPQAWGRLRGRVGGSGESVELRMWIHP